MQNKLFHQIHNSDGMKYINRMHAHSFSYNIFEGNLREIQQSLQLVDNPEVGLKLMSHDNKDAGTQVYKEINRLFHNFLSSAKTLIEHTRIFIDEHYKNKSIHKSYTHKIKMEFAQDELTRFIQDLRNFMLHQGLPHSKMTLKISNENPDAMDIESTISLDIEKLREWSRWSSASKKFLQKQEKELKLSTLVNQYGEKIILLYTWLDNELNKYHAKDILELRNLQDKFQNV